MRFLSLRSRLFLHNQAGGITQAWSRTSGPKVDTESFPVKAYGKSQCPVKSLENKPAGQKNKVKSMIKRESTGSQSKRG